jgi:acetolactate synthase-1/2/3 large subunit
MGSSPAGRHLHGHARTGATNASAGLHVAFQDSTPMILFIGQVGREFLDREAFQEIDYRRMFSEVAKWVAQIEDRPACRIPGQGVCDCQIRAGRAGSPRLAEDMLTAEASAASRAAGADFETIQVRSR